MSLDDRAATYAPELRGTGWGDRVTLRDLLANRSGLPLRAELEFSGVAEDDEDVLSRFASRIAEEEPTPVAWSYTNAGWCLLGRVLESLTGLVWEDTMRANLFSPLAMEETEFVSQRTGGPRAAGHHLTGAEATPVEPWTPRCYGPAGTRVVSTATDLLRFVRLHLDDPGLATLRELHWEGGIHSWLDGWCLGWARFDWIDGRAWGWDGVIAGQRSFLRFLPEQGGAFALMTNGDTGRDLHRSLAPPLMQEAFGVRVRPSRLEASRRADDVSRFAGSYAWPDRRCEVVTTPAGLVLQDERATVELLPLDDCTFLIGGHDPDVPSVTFGAFDENGRPHVLYRMLWGLPRVE